jgi:hypothetical protein
VRGERGAVVAGSDGGEAAAEEASATNYFRWKVAMAVVVAA